LDVAKKAQEESAAKAKELAEAKSEAAKLRQELKESKAEVAQLRKEVEDSRAAAARLSKQERESEVAQLKQQLQGEKQAREAAELVPRDVVDLELKVDSLTRQLREAMLGREAAERAQKAAEEARKAAEGQLASLEQVVREMTTAASSINRQPLPASASGGLAHPIVRDCLEPMDYKASGRLIVIDANGYCSQASWNRDTGRLVVVRESISRDRNLLAYFDAQRCYSGGQISIVPAGGKPTTGYFHRALDGTVWDIA
jgi:hypothetical protein